MDALIPELLSKPPHIFSVSCACIQGKGLIFTLERTLAFSESIDGIAIARMMLRIWRTRRGHPTFEPIFERELLVPNSDSASLLVRDQLLSVIFECNNVYPAVVGQWDILQPKLDLKFRSFRRLGLPVALAGTVNIKPAGRWSTSGLRAIEWLFHPRLAMGEDRQLLGSLNTADSRAVIWNIGTAEPGSPPLAVIPSTLDPVILTLAKITLVAWRRPDPEWSVYFNSPSYSASGGTQALPLFLSELRGNRLVPIGGASEDCVIAEAMVYEVANDGQEKVMFALICGTVDEPFLRIILSEDRGFSFREIGKLKLKHIPTQISISFYVGGAIVGLFSSYSYEGVQGIEFGF